MWRNWEVGEMNYYEVLEQSVKFATDELNQFKATNNLSETTNMVVSSLFRKIIELSAGVMVSASNGLKGPAELNYRGLIEAYLAFRYIIQVPEEVNNRAKAYKIGYHKHQVEAAEALLNNPSNNIDPSFVERANQYHQRELQRVDFQEVLTVYNELQSQDNRGFIPKWYSLNGGPKSINALARRIEENSTNEGDRGLMNKLYGFLSTGTHNLLTIRDVYMNNNGDVSLRPIQFSFDPEEDEYNMIPVRALLTSSIKNFTISLYPEFTENFREFALHIEEYLVRE